MIVEGSVYVIMGNELATVKAERDKYKAALEKLSGQHPAKPIWSASKMSWRLYVDKLEKWRLEITEEALK